MNKYQLGLISSLVCLPAMANVPTLNIDSEQVTVSGLSSGGYMATQFHVAYSNWVSGIGLIATGPYYCAQGSIATALNQCVNKLDEKLPLDAFNTQLESYQEQGLVAPIDNLSKSKVWMLHGKLDTRVIEPVMDGLYQQYASWVPAEQLAYSKNNQFAHHFPTLEYGSTCTESEAPFLGNCGYDAAGEMLTFIIDDIKAPNQQQQGDLIEFDQQKTGGDQASSLANTGYLYVPKSCKTSQCKIHINFHGCNQNAEKVGTEYVTNNGLNRWADTNDMVILYPQTQSSMMMPLNPQACWDWWGYTDENYATNQGQQIQAVRNMIVTLSNHLKDKD